MPIELQYLAWSAALCAVLWAPYIVARVSAWGFVNAMGYPESPPAVPAWAKRSERVHANNVENLAPFAALVLVALLDGVSTPWTELGAALFFWGRIVHAVVYIAAIPYLRTLAFVVSWAGMVIIFAEIVA